MPREPLLKRRILSAILLTILLWAFPSAPAFGQEGDTPNGEALKTNINPIPQGEAIVTLVVNGRRWGDVEAKIDLDDPFLKVSLLKEALSPSLSEKQKERIFSVILSKLEWAGIADLAAAGVTGVWDMETLTYTINTPGEYSTLREIDFSQEAAFNDSVWLKPSNFAAVLNTNLTGSVNVSSTGFVVPLSATFDSLFNIYTVAVEANGSLSYSSPSFTWAFNSARAIYDFPKVEGRLYAGIVSLEGTGYQSRPEIYGVSLHNIDTFSRYSKNYSPSIAFTLQKPSSVRIVINGTVVRTLKLDMGNYRLYDLPFAYGMNSMSIEVEDGTNPDGSIIYKPVDSYITTETGLLVGGKIDYGISAGVGRSEPDQPIANAYFRYGLLSFLTAGINIEADRRSLMTGLNLVAGTGIGGFILNAGSVVAWDGRTYPFAYSADLEYHFAMPADQRMPGISFSAGYASEGFTAPLPSSVVSTPDALVKATASIGGSIAKVASYGLGGTWTHSFGADEEDKGTVSVNFGFAATKNTSLTIGANLVFASDTSPTFSATLGMRTSDPRRPSRQIGVSQSSTGTNTINYNDQFPNSNNVGYGITANNILGGVDEPSSLFFNTGFTTPYFSMSGSAGVNYGSSLTSPLGVVNLNLASALAYVDGYFAVSKPLYDSFVIFVPEKSTGNMAIAFTVDQGTKLISHGMPIAAPLSSYRKSRLAMDFPEADADVVATNPQSAVSSAYRSGFLFKGGLEKLLYVSGRLLDKGNNPIPLTAGDVLKADGTLLAQTFTDEAGTFQIYGLTSGTYKIIWPDAIGISVINVEGNDTGLVEIGDIHATPTPAPATSVPAHTP